MTRRQGPFNNDPFGFGAPVASRAFIGPLIGAGLSIAGGLFGAKSAKGRANYQQKLYEEQRDYNRSRFKEQEDLARLWGRNTGKLLHENLAQGRQSMRGMRQLASRQLNATGAAYKNRIGAVQKEINQVGQTARADIQDQGARSGAASRRALSGRGLGSSTMLAGSRAQNQQVTGRSTSALAESMAGLRSSAKERTTGDLARFMQYRSREEAGLMGKEAAFNAQNVGALASFQQQKTALQTNLMGQNTAMDATFFQNMLSAATGGKGMMGMAFGNAMIQGGNALMSGAFSGGGGGGGGRGGSGTGYSQDFDFIGPPSP